MKLVTLCGLSLVASVAGALAQSSIDEVTAQLEAEGFSKIEVEQKNGKIEFEGYRGGQERELVFDATTWEILSDETHADLEADDDDDGDADHDESDDHDENDDHDDADDDDAEDDDADDDDADEGKDGDDD